MKIGINRVESGERNQVIRQRHATDKKIPIGNVRMKTFGAYQVPCGKGFEMGAPKSDH